MQGLEKIGIAELGALVDATKTEKPKKRILFSHLYKKLLVAPGTPARTAMLLDVIPVKLQQLSHHFLRYDTDGFKFHLPYSGDYIMLVFRKELTNDIFTTLRKAEPDKVRYYRDARGELFQIEILPGK